MSEAGDIMEKYRKTVADFKSSFARVLHPEKDLRELRLNNNTGLLKIIACLTMLVDHLGAVVFPNAYVFRMTGSLAPFFPAGNIMRIIGRLAMPIFAYCCAVGSAYSRNVWKYALRILVLGILVHPLYMTAMNHVPMGSFDWAHNFYRLDLIYEKFYASQLNILFSLALTALILGCVRSQAYVPAVLFVLLTWRLQNRLDYGYRFVILASIFYAMLDHPLASFSAAFLYMWYWGMPGFFTRGTLTSSIQLYAVWALPLIYLPLRSRMKLPKWLFYGFYPAHLVLIYCLRM